MNARIADTPMLSVWRETGFQLSFKNGWTVSVQFSKTHYCQRRDGKGRREDDSHTWTSPDAEIAAWNSRGEWLPFAQDNVRGWVKPDEVAKFIAHIQQQPRGLRQPKAADNPFAGKVAA